MWGIAGGRYFNSEHMVEFLVRKNRLKQDLRPRPGDVEKRRSVTVTSGVLVIGQRANWPQQSVGMDTKQEQWPVSGTSTEKWPQVKVTDFEFSIKCQILLCRFMPYLQCLSFFQSIVLVRSQRPRWVALNRVLETVKWPLGPNGQDVRNPALTVQTNTIRIDTENCYIEVGYIRWHTSVAFTQF